MLGMPLAKTAIFSEIELIRFSLLIFRSGVIPPLTLCAGKGDDCPHLFSSLLHDLGDDSCSNGAATLPDGKPQLLLQGNGGNQLHR